MFYGSSKDVRKRCLKLYRRMKKGETWISIMGELEAGMMDIAEDPDAHLIVTPGSRSHENHFYLAKLLLQVSNKDGAQGGITNDVVMSSLTKNWGVLLVLNQTAAAADSRHVGILEALQQHWGDLVSVGARYSYGGLPPGFLNEQPTVIQFVLARNGTSVERLANEPTLEYLHSQFPMALEHARKAQRAREHEGTLN